MKTLHLFMVLSVLFLCSCNSNQDKREIESPEAVQGEDRVQQNDEKDPQIPENSYLIRDRAAGEFKLGDGIPASHEVFSITKVQQTRNTDEGPTEETVYIVEEGDTGLLSMLPAIDPNTGETTGDIGELRISSAKFKTAEGIGVGSTLEEFIKQYPNYDIWYTYVSGMYVVETEEVQAQFLLKEEDFIGEMNITSEMTPLSKDDFREGTRIRMVRLF